jgi:glycosyltransferase involved in cell wall biosynthesis
MQILFLHQNFPAQFRHLTAELIRFGHSVHCLTMFDNTEPKEQGVHIHRYQPARSSSPNIHPWLIDFESKIIRGEAVFRAALGLKNKGVYPDLVIAHPGWGESLFIKEIWPKTRLGLYCEYHYRFKDSDVDFDPEFPVTDQSEICRITLKNLNNDLNAKIFDAAISPTRWQASTYPADIQEKISVIHDGIDTNLIKPNNGVQVLLNDSTLITKNTEVITFVNRSLEPCRGFHIFMRSLPQILKEQKNAIVLIVGGDGVSYGKPPKEGCTWRQKLLAEITPQMSASELGRIHFLGNIPYDQYINLLQISTVHVYLTYPFVLSWSLLEAMSAGCAIVASKTPPVEEVIGDNENGILIDFFDTRSLAESVIELIRNSSKRRELGASARETIIKKYDLKTICLPAQLGWVNSLLAS